jgi:valyl-tRNA synthetase
MTTGREDPKACGTCGSADLKQDTDVLDTWFSSGLWPFSTLGWPEQTPDLQYFYPTSTMETAYDILFFWVARMIMFGLEFTGKIPFDTVYLSGLIRDEHGRKMSSMAVIDPLTVMDELGTDALRFTLLVGSSPGNDQNLSVKKVEANRNFANKLWNASRFVISAVDGLPAGASTKAEYTLADSWIWAKVQQLVRDVERLFQTFQYGEAGRQIYDFFWSDFADWYVEIAKQQLQSGATRGHTAAVLARVLDTSLRLLHPFTPFVLRVRGPAVPSDSSWQRWRGPDPGSWPERESGGVGERQGGGLHAHSGDRTQHSQPAGGKERGAGPQAAGHACSR